MQMLFLKKIKIMNEHIILILYFHVILFQILVLSRNVKLAILISKLYGMIHVHTTHTDKNVYILILERQTLIYHKQILKITNKYNILKNSHLLKTK